METVKGAREMPLKEHTEEEVRRDVDIEGEGGM